MPGGVWVVCRCVSRVPAFQGRVGERAMANSVGLANHQVVRGQPAVVRTGAARRLQVGEGGRSVIQCVGYRYTNARRW